MHSPHCRALWGLVLAVLAAGCGSNLHPVEGKVVFPDGTPLSGGTVTFGPKSKDNLMGPRGDIQIDGTFQMGTFKATDGAPEGAYRVLIAPLEGVDTTERPRPLPFDARFSSFDKSGLEYTVKAGKNEFFTITVDKPKGRK
jgi:hypothetical protein